MTSKKTGKSKSKNLEAEMEDDVPIPLEAQTSKTVSDIEEKNLLLKKYRFLQCQPTDSAVTVELSKITKFGIFFIYSYHMPFFFHFRLLFFLYIFIQFYYSR